MANISLNTPDAIEFKNVVIGTAANTYPSLLAQVGSWEVAGKLETGVALDSDGGPVLSANDARKLAKWLNRAADALDGETSAQKKPAKRHHHYEEDDDETGGYKF